MQEKKGDKVGLPFRYFFGKNIQSGGETLPKAWNRTNLKMWMYLIFSPMKEDMERISSLDRDMIVGFGA